jgi:hypothetical protein
MKSLLAATLLAAAVLVPGVAHADPYFDYEGNCAEAAVNDTTPGGLLGGPGTWNGAVRVHVVALDRNGAPSGATIAAKCDLRVNGVSRGIVLDAGSGPGAVAGAGPLTYTAAVTDLVELCPVVTIGSVTEEWCVRAVTPICPKLVCGAGGLLEQVVDTVNEQLKAVDPPLCAQLVAAAPAVDDLPSADYVYVDPATGDTYVGGRTTDSIVWDCPPYL